MSTPFQPRFAAYAHAQGQLPQHLPLGATTNADFIRWVNKQWKVWAAMGGYDLTLPVSPSGHEAFDKWLSATYPPPEEPPATRPEGRRSRPSGSSIP